MCRISRMYRKNYRVSFRPYVFFFSHRVSRRLVLLSFFHSACTTCHRRFNHGLFLSFTIIYIYIYIRPENKKQRPTRNTLYLPTAYVLYTYMCVCVGTLVCVCV